MIEITQLPDNVMVLRVVGQLSADDVDHGAKALKSRLSGNRNVGLVADLAQMDGMTLEALLTDLSYQRNFFGHWHQFPRVSVIARGGMQPLVARAVGAVLPQIEVRAFEPANAEQAIAFASGRERVQNPDP
ncbi:STAS/SEC14 domain-containing protein [Pelagibacterium montanilacus]|uniref:STAS/SEC14 domain-containing protein n=1 Tax=Pelagibacterium montanilacus TaxID=2185280 RepID=UPI000F8E0191|nr:STAS/SEC14 domain-containing protein [Pelagibacterium montanilacus]